MVDFDFRERFPQPRSVTHTLAIAAPRHSVAVLLLAAFIAGCGSDPAAPPAVVDGGTDAGTDAGVESDAGPPDAGGPACLGGSVCTLSPNAGCTGGDVCAYGYSGGARTNECVTPGAQARGETCAMNTDCSAGLHCLFGFCLELCCPGASPDACATGTACTATDLNVGGGMTDAVGLCACTVGGASCPAGQYCDTVTGTQGVCLAQGSCDRLAQDCPSGQGCYGTIRECAPAGTAAVGETCVNHSDCVPGHWCRTVTGSASQCSSYCEVGSAATCPAGFTCTSFGDDEPQVGGCYPMP